MQQHKENISLQVLLLCFALVLVRLFTICDSSDYSHVTLQALHPVESNLGQRGSGVLRAALRDIS